MRQFTPRRRRKWVDRHQRRVNRAMAPWADSPREAPEDVRRYCTDQFMAVLRPTRNRYRYGVRGTLVITLPYVTADALAVALGPLGPYTPLGAMCAEGSEGQ